MARDETAGAAAGDGPPWQPVVLDVWRAGQRLSAVGPGPLERQLEHSTALARQLPAPRRAVDLGSGAGIPGLALAGWWPDAEWLLLDAARRRVVLLRDAVERLGWTERVSVRHGRAEDVAHDPRWREWAELVVARSFGPPAVTAECGVAFLRAGGLLVVTEPPAETATGPATGEERWPTEPLAALGLRARPSPGTDVVRVQRLERSGPLPDHVPRRAGVPARRPLF